MQIDQATQLRQLVWRSQAEQRRGAQSPRLIVVVSGKGGVGATSIATNLAMALATTRRVALVDGDLDHADATSLCGVEPSHTLVDVLQSHVAPREALQPGPQGIQVLPGLWGAHHVIQPTTAQTERLASDLQQLDEFDDVLLDVGAYASELAAGLWRAADCAIAVLTPDATALMNTYAAIKRFGAGGTGPLYSIVNHAAGPQTAGEMHRRLADSAHRFLALAIEPLGWLPFDPDFETACCQRAPVERVAPGCAAATALRAMAQRLTASRAPGPKLELEHAAA